VLAFYRVVLRAARTRDAAQREPIQAYARAEFERCGRVAMLGVPFCVSRLDSITGPSRLQVRRRRRLRRFPLVCPCGLMLLWLQLTMLCHAVQVP